MDRSACQASAPASGLWKWDWTANDPKSVLESISSFKQTTRGEAGMTSSERQKARRIFICRPPSRAR